MNAHLQGLEVERAAPRHDDLAVEHRARRQLLPEGLDELGEITVERLLVAALEEDLVAVPEDEHAEAVPLGLEDPPVARRELARALGEHREERWLDGELHVSEITPLRFILRSAPACPRP